MKKISLLICLFLSLSSSAADNKEYWLFAGNPASGKSKIINSLLQKEVAKSGPSIGGVLTKECALYPNPNGNIVYIDTPGLDDVNTRADAAKEIEKALKQNGKYRIFFVIDSNGLKTRPADLDTMKIILDAINLTNIEYNIIVNKFTKRDDKRFQDENASALYYSGLQPGKYTNKQIRFMPLDIDVLQGKSEFLNMEEFLSFVNVNSNSMYLPKDSISTIN